MRCAICKERTNWDISYGFEEFIVCPVCERLIRKEYKGDITKTMETIFLMGKVAGIRRKEEIELDK